MPELITTTHYTYEYYIRHATRRYLVKTAIASSVFFLVILAIVLPLSLNPKRQDRDGSIDLANDSNATVVVVVDVDDETTTNDGGTGTTGSNAPEAPEDPPINFKNVNNKACEDDDTYTFKAWGEKRDCDWISDDIDNRDKFCKETKNGVKVKSKCKVSCNNCKDKNNNDEKPSSGAASSSNDSSSFSCADESGKHFPKNKDKKKRSCLKEKGKKGETKFLKKCQNDVYYRTKCAESCDMCQQCVDDSAFTFKFWSQQRDCAWISQSDNNKQACENKQSVRENCRDSCDNCETNTPTLSPTFLNYDPPQLTCTDESDFVSSSMETCSSIRVGDREESCQEERIRIFCPTTVCYNVTI